MIHRVTAEWSGFTGAPGYTSFHFSAFTGGGDPDAMVERVADFFRPFIDRLPGSAAVTVQSQIEVIDEATGQLEGYEDAADSVRIPSGALGSSSYVGPAGAVVNWVTNTVRDGRRVRGRTFVVPLGTQSFDSSGTLGSNTISDIEAGADALMDANFDQELVVWARPNGQSPGLVAPVTGRRVPDLAAVLRSRRD